MRDHLLHLLVLVDHIVDLLLLNLNRTLRPFHHHLDDRVYPPIDPCPLHLSIPSEIKAMLRHHRLDLPNPNRLQYPRALSGDRLSHLPRRGSVSYNNPVNRIFLHQ
jgi:hypothetical protein